MKKASRQEGLFVLLRLYTSVSALSRFPAKDYIFSKDRTSVTVFFPRIWYDVKKR